MDHHARLMVTFPIPPIIIKLHPNIVPRNRDSPIGYKLVFLQFDGKGSPTALANSNTAAVDVVSNANLSACPDSCFRPVGLAWDAQGRLFMSSDSTGEIYVVTKADGSGVADVSRATTGNGSSPSPSTSSSAPASTGSGSAASLLKAGGYWAAGAAVVGMMI